MKIILSLIISYLLGSISFSYIFGKLLKKVDLRKKGTGNLGATNAWIILGKKIGIMTGILDILKGTLAVIIAVLLNLNEFFIYLSGIFAIIGHIFPFYLNFKGGKGVATSIGIFLGLVLFYKRFNFIVYVIFLLFIYSITTTTYAIIKKEKIKIHRKIWRFVGLIFPILYFFVSQKNLLIFTGFVLLIFSLIELIRFYNKRLNKFLFIKIKDILKEKEINRVSATTWFIFGAFLTMLFFDKNITILCLILSTIGDAFAEFFGKFGKIRILNKTLEGSFAFFVCSFFTALILIEILDINLITILIGSLIASLVELFSYKIDDNFTVPVITGLILSLF